MLDALRVLQVAVMDQAGLEKQFASQCCLWDLASVCRATRLPAEPLRSAAHIPQLRRLTLTGGGPGAKTGPAIGHGAATIDLQVKDAP